jgi:hypothetical protein
MGETNNRIADVMTAYRNLAPLKLLQNKSTVLVRRAIRDRRDYQTADLTAGKAASSCEYGRSHLDVTTSASACGAIC